MWGSSVKTNDLYRESILTTDHEGGPSSATASKEQRNTRHENSNKKSKAKKL